MEITWIHFSINDYDLFSNSSCPYVRDVYELSIQGDKGFLVFNGYHRIENHPPPYPDDEGKKPWDIPDHYKVWFPQPLSMYVETIDKEKKEIVTTTYNIICTRHDIIECTDEYSKDIDEHGHEMEICFFPTNKQKLYFDILPPSQKNEEP